MVKYPLDKKGDTGLIPGLGTKHAPHAAEQPSPYARTTEA